MQKTFIIIMFTAITIFAQVGKPEYIQSSGLFVADGRIYNPDGSEFLMRGVNQNHYWGQEDFNLASIDGIANTHSNVVRVVMSNQDWVSQSRTSAKKKMLVERYIDIGAIPMVELHDGTCENSPTYIEDITDSWTDPNNVAWLNEFEEYVILNIANEWGPGDKDADWQVWRDTYKASITRIREAGINNMIVIDSPGCGQKPRAMQVYGQELLDHDPQHNVVFSIHFYGHWRTRDRANEAGSPNDNSSPWVVEDELKTMLDLKLPVICGEFSWKEADTCPYDTETVIQFCHKNGIGWVAWSWNGNGDSELDMAYGAEYESDADLKAYGKLMVNHPLYGLRATSVAARVFGEPNARPTVTLENVQDGQIFDAGTTINFSAQAKDSDGQVNRMALYVNGSPVFEQDGSLLEYNWENVERGKYSFFVLAEDDNGEYGHTEVFEIKVGYREQTRSVLFVAANPELRTGDLMTAERFEMLGYNATVIADEESAPELAEGMDMVFISSSTSPNNVGDAFSTVPCPVICCESFIFDDMGLTNKGSNIAFGRKQASSLDITNPDHPMAAGLSGTVQLIEQDYLNWGVPAASADIIATLTDTDSPAIFVYEKGDVLANSETAIAPRVGLFLYDTTLEEMQTEGWLLFDAAVDYLQSLPADVEAQQPIWVNDFALEQNYPNPFNPVTTLSYTLPASGKVHLSIYNINGELVETLVNATQNAGHYSVEWNAEHYASGIYFYMLQLDQQLASKRMLLIK